MDYFSFPPGLDSSLDRLVITRKHVKSLPLWGKEDSGIADVLDITLGK